MGTLRRWPTEPDPFESLTAPPDGADADDALYFPYADDEVLCVSEGGIPRPITRDEFRWLDVEVAWKHFLGRWRGQSCYALAVTGAVPEGFARVGLRAWLGRVEPALFYLAGRAKQIVEWHAHHRHCGRCGAPMREHDEDRAMRCDGCGLTSYPRISPSIIVLVRNGEKMLLARNASWPAGMFSTLAGFVEPGESIEQTVHREVREEVGIAVTNLRYLGSQSWPFPNSLMLGFHADYAGGEIVCADAEISEAHWFHYSRPPNVPPSTAISGWLIDAFVAEMEAGATPA